MFKRNLNIGRIGLGIFFFIIGFGTRAQHTGLLRMPASDMFFYPEGRIYTSFKPLEVERADTLKWHRYADSLYLPASKKAIDYILNRDFLKISGKDYRLEILPVIYWEAGRATDTSAFLFANTRGIEIKGELGKQFAFSTAVYENQARFPAYLDTLFGLHGPANGFPATVPAFGIAKNKKKGVLDFPSVRGYVAYRPSKFFMFQLGHDAFFIGEGYRSLLLDNRVPPYGYAQITANVWHVRYVVMWALLQDLRFKGRKFYYRKYLALHYLDWAVSPKFNLGLFESVIWDPGECRGFDLNFLNPVIFFKTAEFQSGTKGGNTLLGLQLSYRPFHQLMFYGQFLLDEMTVSKFFKQPGYWGNKFGLQAGAKAYYVLKGHRFGGLLEWNRIRPYTYSHHPSVTDYSHDYYPLAHPWGANLQEWIADFTWHYKRFGAHIQFVSGLQGVDYPDSPYSYGGDIFRDYEERVSSLDVRILQGNRFLRQYGTGEVAYTLNPRWNARIFLGVTAIRHHIEQPAGYYANRRLTWMYAGLRANMPYYSRDW